LGKSRTILIARISTSSSSSDSAVLASAEPRVAGFSEGEKADGFAAADDDDLPAADDDDLPAADDDDLPAVVDDDLPAVVDDDLPAADAEGARERVAAGFGVVDAAGVDFDGRVLTGTARALPLAAF
jgi:hypothetical protein